MESGDYMSAFNDTMTSHMNAVRAVTSLTQQLSLQDATNALLNVTSNALHLEKVDLTDSQYDSNKWYPVQSNGGSTTNLDKIIVRRELDDTGGASWGHHITSKGHGFTVWREIMLNHNTWGTIPITAYQLANSHNWDDGKNPVHVDEVVDNGGYLLWLRGGAYYNVYTDNGKLSWTIRPEGIKKDDQTFMPTDIEPEDFGTLKDKEMQGVAGEPIITFLDLSTLEKRLEKLGGVIRPALSVIKRSFTLQLGGANYAA